jgi:hypothetical protein
MKIKKPAVSKGILFFLFITIIIMVLFITVISVNGCAKKLSQAASGKNVEESKVTEENTQVRDSKIPEGWPEIIPVNSNIEIQLSGSQKANGKTGWSISGIFAGSGEELYKYYLDKLSIWKKDSDTVNGTIDQEKNYVLSFSNAEYSASILITENKTEVKILLGVNEK